MIVCSWFFFFKQKTAYEMRISDWSSDVCSSDLLQFSHGRWHRRDSQSAPFEVVARKLLQVVFADLQPLDQPGVRVAHTLDLLALDAEYAGDDRIAAFLRYEEIGHDGVLLRSEEHTSELQSLMRSSYAVFCLNKKTNNI